jgi:drug/metabolite transporter (DMT)-like permease
LPSVAVSSLGLLSPVTAVLLGWGLLGQAMSRAVLPAVRWLQFVKCY